jgi:tricarballylate dehydrogenase
MGCTASWSILGTAPVVWGHKYGTVINKDCKRFYDEGKRHFLSTLEMIALETWRDQTSEAYFVRDSVMMDRFRLGWVYIITLDPPEQTRLPGSPIFSNRSSEARNHCQ